MPEPESLILNPAARLVLLRQAGAVVAVHVSAPVRGRPLRTDTIARAREPALFDLLLQIAGKSGGINLDLESEAAARLRQVGLLVPQEAASAPVRFHCFPDDPPAALVPPGAREPVAGDSLVVNETLRLLDDPDPQGQAPLAAECAWARVEHAGAPLPSLLSVRPEDLEVLRRLRPGQAPPPDIAPETAVALRAAGVLIDPGEAARRRLAWAAARAEAGAGYRSERYAVLRGLVHPVQLAAIRRYYRALVESGRVPQGDKQVPLRYVMHNEPLARLLHQDLTGLVSEIAGEALQPSYVYFASYLPGAVLAPHRDRSQCEVSISLLLDYSPEPEGPSPWPLYVESARAPGGSAAIAQSLGDGLLYRGGELTHFRHALPEGHLSASLFLHYVPTAFTGSLE